MKVNVGWGLRGEARGNSGGGSSPCYLIEPELAMRDEPNVLVHLDSRTRITYTPPSGLGSDAGLNGLYSWTWVRSYDWKSLFLRQVNNVDKGRVITRGDEEIQPSAGKRREHCQKSPVEQKEFGKRWIFYPTDEGYRNSWQRRSYRKGRVALLLRSAEIKPLCNKQNKKHELKPFDLAAAGHDGTLSDENNTLFVKPTLTKEINFYTNIQILSQINNNNLLNKETNDEGENIIPLVNWIPTFLGCMEEGIIAKDTNQKNILEKEAEKLGLNNDNNTNKSIKLPKEKSDTKPLVVLENLLSGYSKPNVLDIKLGSILHDKDASEEKIQRLNTVSNSTTSGPFGLRVCGMKLRKFEHIDYSKLDSSFYTKIMIVNKLLGRSQTTLEQVTDTLLFFFENHSAGDQWSAMLLTNFLERINLLIETLQNTPIKLISSSVLFIMETDENRITNNSFEDVIIDNDNDVLTYLEECEENGGTVDIDGENYDKESLSQQLSLSKLKLIDFGHAQIVLSNKNTKFEPDHNTLKGLFSLRTSITNIITQLYQE
ncbi:hypothetical protein ACO0SA_004169 [Hanseniaspora valbyensis]